MHQFTSQLNSFLNGSNEMYATGLHINVAQVAYHSIFHVIPAVGFVCESWLLKSYFSLNQAAKIFSSEAVQSKVLRLPAAAKFNQVEMLYLASTAELQNLGSSLLAQPLPAERPQRAVFNFEKITERREGEFQRVLREMKREEAASAGKKNNNHSTRSATINSLGALPALQLF